MDVKGAIRILGEAVDGIDIDREDAQEAVAYTEGNPLALYYLAGVVREEGAPANGTWKFTEPLRNELARQYCNYLNVSVISNIDPDLVSFCMEVSVVEDFNVELAEYITGKSTVVRIMNQLRECSSGILTAEDGKYRLRYPFLLALRDRRDNVYSAGKVREFCYNAGLYYESHDRLLDAARMYEKSGSDRIRNVLILNGRKNPASGYYHELKSYYLALSEEEIRGNIYLMSGISMLCSLLLAPEQSEHWYRELRRFCDTATGAQKKEAEVQLLSLDIALPHRGSANLVELFKKAPAMVFNRGYILPELSVTSNLPSMMDGGKDFSEWSRNDRALAASIGSIMTRILGKYGRGMVPLAMAESQYEKGGDLAEIVTWVSQGQMLAQNGGKIEMEFVAVRLLYCLCLLSGRSEDAVTQLTTFREKAAEHGADKLLPNIDAMKCRVALLTGDVLAVEDWMKTAPDEIRDFFVMDRLLYLTKVRCYISAGQYLKAMGLTEKLLIYAKRYHRTVVNIEADLLMAIICYRRKDVQWREYLADGLKIAGDYRFVRTISSEGTAILPLLRELMKDPEIGGVKENVPEEWLRQVLYETDKLARRYPSYLQETNARGTDFSRKDIDVLTLQAKGFSVSQIATALSMKPETVRYHIKQNYRKLQVSSKSEAVLAARDIGLL